MLLWVLVWLAAPVVDSEGQGTSGTTGFDASGPAVEGRVLDPQGQALVGARATLEAIEPWATIHFQNPEDATKPVARAVTDEQGRFRLEAPELGLWRVRVGRRGFAEQTLDLRPLIFDRVLPDLELMPATTLEVTLRSPEGKPLVGRLLARPGDGEAAEPKRPAGDPNWLTLTWKTADPAATTDADGKARLPLARSIESVRVEAWAPGHVPLTRQIALGGRARARLDLELTPGELRALKIVESGGRPLPGVLVGLRDWRLAVGRSGPEGEAEVVLPDPPLDDGAPWLGLWGPDGEHGLFSATEFSTSEVSAEPRDPREVEDPGQVEEPEALPEVAAVLELAPALRVRGRVLSSEAHQGLPGALVLDPLSAQGWWAESQADGSFELAVGTGRGAVLAVAPGHHETFGAFDLKGAAAGEGEPAPTTLVLYPAASLSGRVLGPDRVPVAGAEVFIVLSFGRGHTTSMRVARSDEQGAFRWPLVPTDIAFDLRVEPPDALGWLAPTVVEQVPYGDGEVRNGIELLLTAGAKGFGEVLDGRSEPIVGAVVRALEPDLASSNLGTSNLVSDLRPAEARTDGEGRFEFLGLRVGRIDLEARAPGFSPLRVRGIEVPAGERGVALGTLILADGVDVEGRLRDSDGRPVVDAQVVVAEVDELRSALFLVQEGERQADARSDIEGRFRIADRTAGEQIGLAALHPEYVPRLLASLSLPLDERLEVVLQTATRIRGRVFDSEGRPIAGAGVEVVASGPQGASSGRLGGRPPRARTDDQGVFELAGVEPGLATVQAQAKGFLAQRVSGLAVSAEEPLDGVELVLEKGSVLEGEVKTADGRPAAGAVVMVFDFANGERRGFEMADGEGRYRVEGLARGPAMAMASLGEGSAVTRSVDVVPGTQRLDFELEEGFEVRGRVVGPDREPVEGATVALSGVDGKVGQETYSRRAGEFVFEEVLAGRYRLSAHRSGFGAGQRGEVFEVSGPAGPFEVQLRAGVDLVGWVLGLEPEVLARVKIYSELDWLNQTHPDFEGRYRLEGLSPDSHRVIAEVGDGGRRTEATIELEEGAGEVELDLEFPAGFLVTGVLLREGEPMAGARVGLRGVGTTFRTALATSSPEGRFRLEGVPEGHFELLAFEAASDLHHVEPVEIRGDEDLRVEIATGAVVGQVTVGDGMPASGARVALRSLEGRSRFEPQTIADAEGQFRFLAVLEGAWGVMATLPGYVSSSAEVEVRRGLETEEVELRLEPAVGLTIWVRRGGAPWAGALWVAFLGAGGELLPGGLFHADDQGRALVDRAPEQARQLVVSALDFAQVIQPITVPGEVEVVLEPGGRLEISVPELADTPIVAELSLTRADGRRHYWIHHTGQLETLRSFRGERTRAWQLAPGPWTASVRAEDGRRWVGTVTVDDDGVTQIELGASDPGSPAGEGR